MDTINSISAFHRLLSLPDPLHPLVSVVHVEDMRPVNDEIWERFFLNFYTVSLKREVQSKGKYGQHTYDFDKGLMSFTAPRQMQSHVIIDDGPIGKGYVLMFHPDFLGRHPLATTIKNYGFFSYAVHEALHLSAKEETNIIDTFKKIEEEYQHIDRHTQDIILAQIETLLSYSNRFYERQFITRKNINSDLLSQMDAALERHFANEKGLPSVDQLAGLLNVSPDYLSDMLRALTGQSAQQHIHEKLIEKAKEFLMATNLSVAEVAYHLGFEYPQSFNKLFKKKMNISPLAFRRMVNGDQ